MNIVFTPQAWDDYTFWQKQDRQKIKRINELLKDISRSPFSGIGKAEPLKWNLDGYWSRRIDQEHRLVYKIENKHIYVIACRYHYEEY